MTIDEIDEPTLLAAAARAGEAVTGDQLKRWRRAGLMPRPRTAHVRGLRGSRAWYPDWAIEQLIAVARLHRSMRRLNDLTVVVWFDGHWIERTALRKALAAVLERVSSKVQRARAGHDDPYSAADAILERPTGGPRSPIVDLMSRRLGKHADLQSLMWTLLVLGLGGGAPWDDADQSVRDSARSALDLIAVSGGVPRAMTDDLAGHGPWLPADFEVRGLMDDLRAVGAFDIGQFARAIHVASDEELDRARDDALMFGGAVATIGRVLGELRGDDAGGVGSLAVLAPADAFDRAALVRNMLILRPLAGDEAFARIAAMVDENHERYAAIDALRTALPQHQHLLGLDFEQRLAELAPAEAQEILDAISAYLQDHPQIAQVLK